METKHYIVENIAEFSEQTEVVKKLQTYLDCIEDIAFPAIEEVFGQTWNDGQINIKLDDSTSRARYYRSGFVKMGINNRNIQKNYPQNLWGCLFHETHHAFLDLIIREKRDGNLIIRKKRDGKIFNGGHKAEVFNYAFIATTYLKLKEKSKIDTQVYECFLNELERELGESNREYRAPGKCECEKKLRNNTMDIFREYIGLFSMNIENFAKFISYVKSHNSVFTNRDNFRQDLDKAEEALES